MVQALLAKGQEQEGEEDVVWGEGWGGWVETVLGQAPVGIVFVLAAEQGFLIRWEFPAMI
jgi:hypothetical protein